MNSIYINISNWANIHKDNITNTSINTHYIEPDIDYSIRKRFNHKMVNRIGLIEDRIANTSFIFYHSSMLGWVKVDPGEKYVRTVFSIVLSNNINILSSSIMIDIGANMGYYGILSLSMGIGKAIFFEPQPACVQIIESLVTLNAFNQRARIINHPIGNGKLLEVPSMECDGRFPINKQENGKVNAYGNNNENDIDMNNENNKAFVSFFNVETALREYGKILITKIDTEGFELIILPLLFEKFKKHQLINVIVEITPLWWKYTNHSIEEGAFILAQIIEFGYDATSVIGTILNTKQQMIEFVLKQKEQIDMWYHCVAC